MKLSGDVDNLLMRHFVSLQIQLKFLAEEMQAISKGLEKVVQELSLSESDGPVSEKFHMVISVHHLRGFYYFAQLDSGPDSFAKEQINKTKRLNIIGWVKSW